MTDSTSKRPLVIAALIGAVALAAGVALATRSPEPIPAPIASGSAAILASAPEGNHPPPRPQEPPKVPAGPEELALIAPLEAGSALVKGWTVRDVSSVRDGTMRVACADEAKGRVDLEVALNDEAAPLAPAVAGRYAVFYSARRVVPEDAEKLAKALAKVLEKNQAAPPPKGMTVFRPKNKEPETL